METLQKILNKQEPLDPELSLYVSEGSFGKILRHPLVFAVPYFEQENALLNERLKHKKDHIEKCLREGDWNGVIWMHERPYRLNAFKEIERRLNDKEYWEILGSIWIDSENIWQHRNDLKRLFRPKNRDLTLSRYMMDKEEREAFQKLSDPIIVYRGCTGKNKTGYSWTLNKDTARWFAKRFIKPKQSPLVLIAEIKKEHVFAYFERRGEFEILLFPEHLKNVVTERC